MADMHFEQSCPCGGSIKVSGYENHVKPQVSAWQRVHDKHANNIAKAVAESKKHPLYTWWPQTNTLTSEQLPNTFVFNQPMAQQDKQE